MRTIEIKWKHLEKSRNASSRCAGTGEALEKTVRKLANECGPQGWNMELKETKLSEKRLLESNLILIDDTPIERPRSSQIEPHC